MQRSPLSARGPFLLAWLFCALGICAGVLAVIGYRLAVVLLVLHALGRM